jgi:hypothetical protein
MLTYPKIWEGPKNERNEMKENGLRDIQALGARFV